MANPKRKIKKYILRTILVVFIGMNLSAMMHAYHFTHYDSSNGARTLSPEQMRWTQKVSAILFGVSLPRPVNDLQPNLPFQSFTIDNKLSCWSIRGDSSKPTILLFHGYGNRKDGMLDRAEALHEMGYNTVLIDFEGSGASSGNTCTIGYKEAEQVKRVYDFMKEKIPETQLVLLGRSMGAAAIMRCLTIHSMKPKSIILECPFGSLFDAAGNRFDAIGLPRFPLVHMLIFYGGLMNGFWAFDYKPTEYAKQIKTPSLLLTGGSDDRVTPKETETIYANLGGDKNYIVYPEAGHESYLIHYRSEWKNDVDQFIQTH